jgi:hypothetical protein
MAVRPTTEPYCHELCAVEAMAFWDLSLRPQPGCRCVPAREPLSTGNRIGETAMPQQLTSVAEGLGSRWTAATQSRARSVYKATTRSVAAILASVILPRRDASLHTYGHGASSH